MKNIPDIKLGIVVGSTDWLPSDLAINQRVKLVECYQSIYKDDIYECPICVDDNEINVKRAIKDIKKAECNALVVYFANYGPESASTLLVEDFGGPVMLVGASEESSELIRGRKDSLSGLINACYALDLKGIKIYLPKHPIGSIEENVRSIHDFIAVARTIIALKDLKVVSFGPRPSSYLAAYAPYHSLYDLGLDVSDYSEMELLNSFNKHDGDKRIETISKEMEAEYERYIDTSLLTAALYTTAKRWKQCKHPSTDE